MALFICEKPSQARDIGRVLGATSRRDGYLEGRGQRVTWCIGHLLEMVMPDDYRPEWKGWHLHTLPILPDRWRLEVRQAVGKQYKIIEKLLRETTEVVIATDADREGETIGREVLEQCGYRGDVSRLWLSALDEASIRKALKTMLPGQKTEPLYRAGLGRARADWLVGMNLTRAYTILGRQGGYDGVLTVGRVQTPTLKLVVDRDRLIEHFKPIAYFDLIALFRVKNGSFKAKWLPDETVADEEGRCLDKKIAAAVADKVRDRQGAIAAAGTKRVKEPPPLPLELSSLQQEASRRWGMGASRVLNVAQSLYETHKAITYPRTDCRYLPNSQFQEAPEVLQAMARSDAELAGLIGEADVGLRSKAWNDKKITAHHAIIPTAAVVNVGGMSLDERRLYDLVRRHYLAQFFPAFEYDRTVIDVAVEGERFRASGNVEMVPGWKRVLRGEKKKENDGAAPLPLVKKKEPARVQGVELEEKRTKPPNRYTEGTLIQAMKTVGRMVEDPRFKKVLRDTAGIGTEATRAAIIENLLKRRLLDREGKKHLISTPPGRALVDILPRSVTNPATTAVWEQALEDVASGAKSLEAFQEKAVIWVSRLVAAVKEGGRVDPAVFAGLPPAAPAKNRSGAKTPAKKGDHPCPKCGLALQRRQGVRGWFWGCSDFPACKATLPDRDGQPDDRQPSGPVCPQCQNGVLTERTAKRGKGAGKPFLGCSNYPKCRYTRAVDESAGVPS